MTTNFPFTPPFDLDMVKGVPGMEGSHMPGEYIETGIWESAVQPGRFVVRSTAQPASKLCRLPGATGEIATAFLRGVVKRSILDNPDPYAPKELGNVKAKGSIFVEAFDLLSMATPTTIFIIHAGANAGKVRLAAGSGGDAATAAPQGIRLLQVLSATCVEIMLNIPA